jgi:Protein of unknown function (DUF2795)
MAHTTVKEVLDALGEVDFPAGKDQLLAAARAAGASEEVQKALRGIPPDEYANRDEVARSVRLDPDYDLGYDAAQKAEQARLGGRPGLSQHLREVPKPPVEDELRP